MIGLLLASQAARLAHRRRRFARASVTLPVSSATHQNKTRPKTYPRSPERPYHGCALFIEGVFARRFEDGARCGARCVIGDTPKQNSTENLSSLPGAALSWVRLVH